MLTWALALMNSTDDIPRDLIQLAIFADVAIVLIITIGWMGTIILTQ